MLVPYVEIYKENVVERLKFSKSEFVKFGFLLGNYSNYDEVSITISSCSSVCDSNDDVVSTLDATSHVLSGDTSIVGLWFKTTENVDTPLIEKFCLEKVSDKLKPWRNFLVIYALPKDEAITSIHSENIFIYNKVEHSVTPASVNILQTPDFLRTFRIAADLPVMMTLSKDTDITRTAVQHIKDLKQQIDSERTVFHIKNSSVLLGIDKPVIVNNTRIDDATSAKEILKYIEDDEVDSFSVKKAKKTKKKISDEEVVDVSLLTRITHPAHSIASPVAYYKSGLTQQVQFALPVNVVVQVNENKTPVSKLPKLFINAVCKQLAAMATCVQKYSTNEICIVRPFHFQPWGCNQFVTIIYPDGKTDKDLESERRTLHEMLLLPLDKPLLRRNSAYRFPADKKNIVYLENTHIGLKNDGSDGSKVYLVQGTYSYHHYMQDKFNDDKWGCAYRSLQTIVSWFRHQGYTDVPVPSHRVIQQTLVDVGDKDAKFVGSRNWIGSIEVCTVLDQLLEVTSKIMFVNTGSEMANKGRELAHHFETQGTPIMIGGGVLAHTILGVDFNDKSGALKFLILDPHYTGSEDIKIIQDKGWCGWKGSDFWDPNVFYNMCLPQRPHVI
ncbi:ufm1-specific protease 2-like [Antedon mediterranea]|uniref:ufm1-specific protease 2-like n=1 Tax=Antedon mediterranea TaxID=105859 RepID=UPI003AF7450E